MRHKAGGLTGRQKIEQKQLTKTSCFSKIINAVGGRRQKAPRKKCLTKESESGKIKKLF